MEKDKKSKIIESLCIFLFFTIFITILNLSINSLNYDIMWCFHLSQKVANGYKMYSEISTVVTPIYFWIGGLFIKLFGNAITSMCIYAGVVQGVIATTIYNITKEVIKKENPYIIPLCLFFLLQYTSTLCLTNYNSTAMMWILIAVYVEIIREKRNNPKFNYLIGILLGLAFFTKQNIGAFGVIATGIISIVNNLYYKKQNPMKEIIQKATAFLGVTFVMLIYFLASGTFMNFVDFCIGGLLEFGDKNLSFGIPVAYVGLFVVALLGFAFSFDENKDVYFFIMTIYMLGMSTIIYPLTNTYHAVLGMLMTLPIMIKIAEKVINIDWFYNIFVAVIAFWCRFSSASFDTIFPKETELLYSESNELSGLIIFSIYLLIYIALAISIIKQKPTIYKNVVMYGIILVLLTNAYFYIDNLRKEDIPEKLSIYANHGYTEKQINYINNVVSYILQKEEEGYNVYVVSADASYYMAALNRNNYKYDLTLYGSLGYKGEERLIEETSKLENALIIKDAYVMFQEPIKFDEFIKNNYEVVDKIENLVVYGERNIDF